MKQRVFIIHGWGSNPESDWIPWISNILRGKGLDLTIPAMPNTDSPSIESWVKQLRESVGTLLPTDIFIGHSIGCQTILRYLEKLPAGEKADKIILVAPWLTLKNLEDDESWNIARPWLHTLIDLTRLPTKANEYSLFFSDNDPFVPLEENVKFFEKWMHPKITIRHHKGHFTKEDGIITLPEILESI